jgi:hypothetical protein
MVTRLLTPFIFFLAISSHCLAQPVAADPEAKPYLGTWGGQENRQLGLPAPKLKIRKDGTGAYFLANPDKPLY